MRAPVRLPVALLVLALLAVAQLTVACGRVVDGQPTAARTVPSDQQLIADYFERGRAAAAEGSAAQKQFLDLTQHPDVRRGCDLGDLTVQVDPTLSTLRPANGWRPPGSQEAPRGRMYVVAVTVTVRRNGTTLGTQIGSMHVVVLDGAAYGFAPCPA